MLKSRDLAQHTQDDAFREIQLNGKQLVFLFMVATVVSVVIFLCGVFVGRGVQGRTRAWTRRITERVHRSRTSPTSQDAGAATAGRLGSDRRRAARRPSDELSYFNRLDKSVRRRRGFEAGRRGT